MHIRVIYILKSLVNYSIYTDAYSLRLCQSYGFKGGAKFYMRCLYFHYPLAINFIIFNVGVLVLSNLIRVFEIPYYRSNLDSYSFLLDNFFQSVWLIVMTVTTVGYGDIRPYTIPG